MTHTQPMQLGTSGTLHSYALMAYFRTGYKRSFRCCFLVFRFSSCLFNLRRMARVFFGRRSRGLYFLPCFQNIWELRSRDGNAGISSMSTQRAKLHIDSQQHLKFLLTGAICCKTWAGTNFCTSCINFDSEKLVVRLNLTSWNIISLLFQTIQILNK